ncbi:acyltransferase [Sphingobium sp. KCTC 72723]|uniref:acyltransferase n=1 Tax=Sphingobium sp. KCTC 72723 TaxID=2733867 RepID=UPI001CB6F645|nr:DapH/DapD/GlmU-related protein [Sphingobium sp. KCTC 72723]
MDIDPSAQFSLSTKFDHNNPMGIHIGAQTYIAFHALILAYDFTRELYYDTFIGKRCFIGARSIILPGVTIGDDVIAHVVGRKVLRGGRLADSPYGCHRRRFMC